MPEEIWSVGSPEDPQTDPDPPPLPQPTVPVEVPEFPPLKIFEEDNEEK